MAFPQVEATNHSAEGVTTTSHTVSLPANIQAGETLLVFFAYDSATTVSFPAGWTEIYDNIRLAIAWRKADGGEGASITVTTAASKQTAHISYRISGAIDPTETPPEVSTGVFGGSLYPDPDALTPTGGENEYLWIAATGTDDGRDLIIAFPTNYTDGEAYQSAESYLGCCIGVARRELEASSENPSTFTLEEIEQWDACTVAVYPPPPPPPPPPVPVADGDLIGIGVIRKS